MGILTNSTKIVRKCKFVPERSKNGSKKANIILFSISRVFGHLTTIYFRFPKATEDCRRFPKTNEEVRPLPKMSEEPSKHLTVFSSETVNIKKLANLTANTKTLAQITLNTKPHSDPPHSVIDTIDC